MNKKQIIGFLKSILYAVAFTGLGVLIRALFFADLGRGIPYLTFYPTVALVAIFGTLTAGLLTTVAGFFLTFYWIQGGHLSNLEILAEGIFVGSGILISFVGGMKTRLTNKLIIAQKELEIKNNEIVEQNRKLEEAVAAYEKAQKMVSESRQELDKKIQDLETTNELMVGREIKMTELKEEIEKLKQQLAK